MEINENEIGIEYAKALLDAISIRKMRRSMYGDSFLTDSYDSLFNIIDGKRKRFHSIPTEFKYKREDEIIDIINYYLFILAKIQHENRNI